MLDIRWDYQESVLEVVLGTGKFTNQSGVLAGQDPALGWANVASDLCPSRPKPGDWMRLLKEGGGSLERGPNNPSLSRECAYEEEMRSWARA